MSDKPLSKYTYGELLDELNRRRRETIQAGIPECADLSAEDRNVIIASTVIIETLDQYGVYGVTYVGANNASIVNIYTPEKSPLYYDRQTDTISFNFDGDTTVEAFKEAVTQWGVMRQQLHQLTDKVDLCCVNIADVLAKEGIEPPAKLCDPAVCAPLDLDDNEAVEQRLDQVEQTIDLLLRRNQVNGIIGLCAGLHTRGSCLLTDPVVANKASQKTSQGLIREVTLAHQLNHMAGRLAEGIEHHFQYTLDVARNTGADVDKLLETISDVNAGLNETIVTHSRSRFARSNTDPDTDN